jgi:hypothetical protein
MGYTGCNHRHRARRRSQKRAQGNLIRIQHTANVKVVFGSQIASGILPVNNVFSSSTKVQSEFCNPESSRSSEYECQRACSATIYALLLVTPSKFGIPCIHTIRGSTSNKCTSYYSTSHCDLQGLPNLKARATSSYLRTGTRTMTAIRFEPTTRTAS